ncbi:MAG: agmatine deiminase family protein [Sulfitobacter sp.]
MHRRDVILGAGAFGLMGEAAMARPKLYVPPEEAPHAQTIMMWPASRKVHPDPVFLEMLQETIIRIANTIATFEPVVMLADKSQHAKARKHLSAAVTLWDIPTEDLWARDAGPLFAWRGQELAVSHIQFNGWGKNQIHKHDGQVASRVAQTLGVPLVPSGLIGEAGGVEHDGEGLLIAHQSSWWRKRNARIVSSEEELKSRLLSAYGATQMIWTAGVAGEDITDYHIDSLARFAGPGRVLMNLPASPDWEDPFHAAAFNTRDVFKERLEVETIPEPNQRRVTSIDFVASYVNYYVCNGAVIAPEFGDPETDAIAVDALKRHYPGRQVITLNVDALGEVGGGIHCATQQIPA